ncbi:unnamed protein product [Phytophthora lilii]|uniref:Unnamed protein product n=1 Tax=Phytophthora lilii TaxID=2077276 RepID=A0A9W7CP02_9STRA|nr:unnamed protein product [Phytophthora lilii]
MYPVAVVYTRSKWVRGQSKSESLSESTDKISGSCATGAPVDELVGMAAVVAVEAMAAEEVDRETWLTCVTVARWLFHVNLVEAPTVLLLTSVLTFGPRVTTSGLFGRSSAFRGIQSLSLTSHPLSSHHAPVEISRCRWAAQISLNGTTIDTAQPGVCNSSFAKHVSGGSTGDAAGGACVFADYATLMPTTRSSTRSARASHDAAALADAHSGFPDEHCCDLIDADAALGLASMSTKLLFCCQRNSNDIHLCIRNSTELKASTVKPSLRNLNERFTLMLTVTPGTKALGRYDALADSDSNDNDEDSMDEKKRARTQ